MNNKKRIIFYFMITICFILGFLDFYFTNILLETGYFIEINPFAFPYFLIVPIMLLFPKDDKYIITAIGILNTWLFVIVINNVLNFTVYLGLVI